MSGRFCLPPEGLYYGNGARRSYGRSAARSGSGTSQDPIWPATERKHAISCSPVATRSSGLRLQRQYWKVNAARFPLMAFSRISNRTSSNAMSSAKYSHEKSVVTSAKPLARSFNGGGLVAQEHFAAARPPREMVNIVYVAHQVVSSNPTMCR
jgi:hypothetical protein